MKTQWMGLTIEQMQHVITSTSREDIKHGLKIVTANKKDLTKDEIKLRNRYYRNRQIAPKKRALPMQRIIEILKHRDVLSVSYNKQPSNEEIVWLLDPDNQTF